MSPEDTVIEALKWARSMDVRILRGPVFDFCDYTNYPRVVRTEGLPACNAIGAVLLRHELQGLCYPNFAPHWERKLLEILSTDRTWLWRFDHGWNRGNCLVFEVTKKGETKSTTVYDEVSRWGNRMANEWVSPQLLLGGRAAPSVPFESMPECNAAQ